MSFHCEQELGQIALVCRDFLATLPLSARGPAQQNNDICLQRIAAALQLLPQQAAPTPPGDELKDSGELPLGSARAPLAAAVSKGLRSRPPQRKRGR